MAQWATLPPESFEWVEKVCEEAVEKVGECGISGTGGGMYGISP
jgi:hypothetical protein